MRDKADAYRSGKYDLAHSIDSISSFLLHTSQNYRDDNHRGATGGIHGIFIYCAIQHRRQEITK